MFQKDMKQALKLLAEVADRQREGCEPVLHKVLQYSSEAVDPLVRDRVLGAAHLSCSSVNGRHLEQALLHYRESMNKSGLKQLLNLALFYGEFPIVWQIHILGQSTGDNDLCCPNFKYWFRRHGIRWFPLYHDPDAQVSFIRAQHADFIYQLVGDLFQDTDEFWKPAINMASEDSLYSNDRLLLLKKLAAGLDPVIKYWPSKTRSHVDRDFRQHCRKNKIVILRVLQHGQENPDYHSWVYLVLDSDGLVKVFKEQQLHLGDRLAHMFEDESELYEQADQIDGLARCYGKTQVGDHSFIRTSFCYGQDLIDLVRNGQPMPINQACHLIRQLATIMAGLHDNDLLYLDLRPQNVKINGCQVKLFDLNSSRKVGPDGWIDAFPLDPRYVAPEIMVQRRACRGSDVFQLGVLFHQLITGQHPFKTEDDLIDAGAGAWESKFLKFALPNTYFPYRPTFNDSCLSIIKQMLNKNPAHRPTMARVAQFLGSLPKTRIEYKKRSATSDQRSAKNTVLFPARMALPHKGHIEYLSRLLELGFFVRICLQRSYTITDRDPYEKFLVMKMVELSLLERGFSRNSFEFMLTPFYENDQLHRMHFAMMPDLEDIVAVASSNPDVNALLPRLPILDQRTVFAQEDVDYEVRSWGARLRQAVREGDRETFDQLAASGVLQVLDFDQLQSTYAEQPVEFLKRMPKLVLSGVPDQDPIVVRASRYMTPEESLLRRATQLEILIADLVIVFDRTEIKDGDKTIYFKLI